MGANQSQSNSARTEALNYIKKKFGNSEYQILTDLFQSLAARSPNPATVSKDTFLRFFDFPGVFGERLFDLFDAEDDHQINFHEFMFGLSSYIHGTTDEQYKILFNLYDVDGDHSISRQDLSVMLFSLSKVPAMIPGLLGGEDENKQVNSLDIDMIVAHAFQDYDWNHSGDLSFPQFKHWMAKSPAVLNLLSLNFQRHSFESTVRTTPSKKSTQPRAQPLSSYHCGSCQWECRFCPYCGFSLQEEVKGNTCPSASCRKQIFSTSSLRFCLQCGEGLTVREVKEALPQADPRQVKTGILCVRRRHVHGLKTHVYVLRDQFLYSFRKHHDKIPLRVMFIEGLFFEEVNEGPSAFENVYTIAVRSAADDRVEYLYALSQEDRSSWIRALRDSAHTTLITDLYEFGEKVGSGKFGTVFSSIDLETREKVAIKQIEMKALDSEEKENLRGEIAIMRLVDHRNIVRLRHVFQTKETTFLVTDLAQSGDLLTHICREAFTEAKVFKIVKQIVSALDYLHVRGIVHRDLKLENVLVRDEKCDRVLLTDFGFSKFVIADHTESAAGTLTYVAP